MIGPAGWFDATPAAESSENLSLESKQLAAELSCVLGREFEMRNFVLKDVHESHLSSPAT